jgi:DNA-binding MarR family transcriptional regulator
VESLIKVWENERPDVPMGSLRVSLPLRRALQHAESRRAKVLARHGVSAATLDLLVALRRSGKPYVSTPSELARLLVLSSGGVSQRLERLEREGLVERRVSTEDRRVVLVHLTEAGLDTLDRLIDEYMAHEEAMLRGLSERQITQLGQLLGRLDASISASGQSHRDSQPDSRPDSQPDAVSTRQDRGRSRPAPGGGRAPTRSAT